MERTERDGSIVSRRNALRTGATAGAAGAAALLPSIFPKANAQDVQNITLTSFHATGLPAGPVTGVAVRSIVGPGFSLKHVHGGNVYVFVASGTFTVDVKGNRTTYRAGEFFWEPSGEDHTAITETGAELYVLSFLMPRAEFVLVTQ
jgi:quercetin dioxygenase-like cupin family protein